MKTSIIATFAFLSATRLMSEAGEGSDLGGAAPAKPQTLVEKLTAKANALRTRIEGDTAAYNAIAEQLQAIALVANVAAQDTVTATSGKGDKAVAVTGVVLGVAEDESGKLIKVQAGSGFDTTVYTFRAAQIVSVVPYVAPVVEDESVEMPAATPEYTA